MKSFVIILLSGVHGSRHARRQSPQVSNQMAQVSNQAPQISNQRPQESNQAPQVSNQTPQISDQRPQTSNQVPQVPNGYCNNGVCWFKLFDGGFASNDTVAGRENADYPDVIEFSGIKFADSIRFRSPIEITDYANTDFSNPGFSCVTVNAVNVGAETLEVDTAKVEDCLYIRIWMKKSALMGGNKRKVLSWIHGGTFNFGGVDVIYESPAKLVDEQDIIVAKMNYRLGPFGNWYFPMGLEGQPKSSWGIQDQRLGLKWVHDHIAKFNGNENDITLGGASSGGMSVMVHMTSPASHAYFHNALVIGPPQINFWNETEATMAYGFISGPAVLGCTTEETFAGDMMDGSLLACLQSIPLPNFQAATALAGDIFKQIALNSNHISQLEMLYALNIDGDIITHNPRDLLKSQSSLVKSDMGFYLHELGENEGTSMTQDLFTNDAFKQTLYGEHYSSIFQDFNSHITVPKPAHDGLISTMYGESGETFMSMILGPSALGCQGTENDPYQGLLTECKTKTADWVTSWLWHCNTRDFLSPLQTSSTIPHLYAVAFSAAYPGPDHNQSGVMMPDIDAFVDCYEAGGGKSCHTIGQSYLFGEAEHQGLSQTPEQIQFGVKYRTVYANLMKTGSHKTPLVSWSNSGGQFNHMDIDTPMVLTNPYPMTCMLFDQIQLYGMI